jgi:hypothetical protein
MLKAGIKQCYWIVFLNACGIRALGGAPAISSGITDVQLRRGNCIRLHPSLTITSQETYRAFAIPTAWINNYCSSAVNKYLVFAGAR